MQTQDSAFIIQSDKLETIGIPSISFFSNQLHLSANYFGDLTKKETGKTAQEYIQLKMMEIARDKIFDTNKSLSKIAYELGFKYPQHFTLFFKTACRVHPKRIS